MNKDIRDAVEKICADLDGFSAVGPAACAVRATAKRLYPLSKPRELDRYGTRWRVIVTPTGNRLECNGTSDSIAWYSHTGSEALSVYDQLKTLGFTEEE